MTADYTYILGDTGSEPLTGVALRKSDGEPLALAGLTAVLRVRPEGGEWEEHAAAFDADTGTFSYTPSPEHLPEPGRYELRFRLKSGGVPVITVPTGAPRVLEVLEG